MCRYYERFEHAGVIAELVPDDDMIGNPQDNDNAGKLYSWTRDFDGDERISEPDLEVICDRCEGEGCPDDDGNGWLTITLAQYFASQYDSALTIPLRFSDYGSTGARIYETDEDNANCALVFTAEEIEREWPIPTSKPEDRPESMRDYVGGIEAAKSYAHARIDELDNYLQGYVFGIVIRERDESIEDPDEDASGEILESVWGFIGDPSSKSGRWIYDEARSMAEGCAETVKEERREAYEMACRDIVTVG